MAAYRFLINRMIFLPLITGRKQAEWQKIVTIARNNRFHLYLKAKLITHIQNKAHTTEVDSKKWTTSTYYSPKIRKI
jgi:hypothetical protein